MPVNLVKQRVRVLEYGASRFQRMVRLDGGRGWRTLFGESARSVTVNGRVGKVRYYKEWSA